MYLSFSPFRSGEIAIIPSFRDRNDGDLFITILAVSKTQELYHLYLAIPLNANIEMIFPRLSYCFHDQD